MKKKWVKFRKVKGNPGLYDGKSYVGKIMVWDSFWSQYVIWSHNLSIFQNLRQRLDNDGTAVRNTIDYVLETMHKNTNINSMHCISLNDNSSVVLEVKM